VRGLEEELSAPSEPASATSIARRVLGRFNLWTGSAGTLGDAGEEADLLRFRRELKSPSAGECVTDLRFLDGSGPASMSRAFSRAFQAIISSTDSGSGGSGFGRETVVLSMLSRKGTASLSWSAPPWASAMSRRRSHAARSATLLIPRRLRGAGISSARKGKSRSRLVRSKTVSHMRAQSEERAIALFLRLRSWPLVRRVCEGTGKKFIWFMDSSTARFMAHSSQNQCPVGISANPMQYM